LRLANRNSLTSIDTDAVLAARDFVRKRATRTLPPLDVVTAATPAVAEHDAISREATRPDIDGIGGPPGGHAIGYTWAMMSQLVPAPVEGDFLIRDWRFADGDRLPELRLHYTTLGEPRRDAAGRVANAVLILHGTGGSGRSFLREQFAGELFGPGQLLDARQHYLILPDGIGHGRSSKPSDGLHARFPRYTYADMIAAQHALVTQGLGIDRLRLVMGTSMGGMHSWMWGHLHPTMPDALLPLASLPVAIAGRNRMLRRMAIDAIRTDPDWRAGDYAAQPRGLTTAIYVLLLMVSAPIRWHLDAPTPAAADALFDRMVGEYQSTLDANDLLYQIEASRDYDPAPHLERISAPLLAINFADDLVNPPELGILEREIARVPRGEALVMPASEATSGHRTHSLPALWKQHLARLLDRLPTLEG
jgi:homoserine O-acetyltransferase/O-succinyltransferase